MKPTRPLAIVTLVAAALLGGAAQAQGTPSKAEQALKYRKSV